MTAQQLTGEELIRVCTEVMRFGLEGQTSVDARGWAQAAERMGFSWQWALQWIRAGWPSPPPWTWSRIRKEGAD